MEFLGILEQAQQGNYDSYELLLNSLSGNNTQILAFFEFFLNTANAKASRELVGIFLKNWLGKEQGKIWWTGYELKEELISRVLVAEDVSNISSMILLSLLLIEDSQHNMKILNMFLMCSNKLSVLALSYYVESSKTVLQGVINCLANAIPALLQTDPLFGLQVFQRSASHLPPGPSAASILALIFGLIQMNNDYLQIELYKSVVDMISHFYDYIQNYIENIIEFICQGIFSDESEINHLSFESINIIADIEQEKKNEGLNSFQIIERYSEKLLLALIKKVEESDKEEEEILLVCSAIQGICEIISNKVLLMLPAIGEKLKSPNANVKMSGVYLVGSIIASLSADKIEGIKSEILITIQMSLSDQSPKIQKASIWLILKISENIPDLIKQNPAIFEVLFSSLDSPQKNVIDCLLEISDNDVPFPFPERFIEKLMFIGLNTKLINSLSVVRSIVQNMQAESLSLVSLIRLVLPLISSNHRHLSPLSIILRACLEKLSLSLISEFYEPIMSILAALPLNDEYLIACSCLSRNPLFKNYIDVFSAALSNAISLKESYQTGIICISELVRNLEFSEWLPPLMPALIKILNVRSQPNTQIIEALADIVSLHTSICFPYLQELLNYTDFCARFCLSDFDDPELLVEVKELLVNFYEGLIQGLESISKLEAISGRVGDIMKFCVIISQDIQNASPNIIAGVIGIFADIALAFGSIPERENILKFVKQFVQSDSEIVRMNAECALKTLSSLD